MSHYFVFLLTAIVAVAIPGPDFLLVFQTSIRKGRKEGFGCACGIALGLCVHGMAATLGLSAILLKSAQAFEVVKYLGAAYLVYLAFMLIKDLIINRKEPQDSSKLELDVKNDKSFRNYVARGFFTNVLNIKAALFFVAIVPQFVYGKNLTLQFGYLSLTQVVVALTWFSLLSIFVNKVGRFFKRRVVQRWLDGTTAAIFIGLAGKLATTRRS